VAQNHDLELALTPTAGEQTNETAEERYSRQVSKTRSLNRSGHHRQHTVMSELSFFTPHLPPTAA
jgi:hypothetical protein